MLMPKPVEIAQLSAGEVGFFAATIKTVSDTRIGDTVTEEERPAGGAIAGIRRHQADGLRGAVYG